MDTPETSENLINDPCNAPAVSVDRSRSGVPEGILREIRNGSIAACISGAITLLVVIAAMMGHRYLNFTAWTLIDVLLILVMAFGIYRRSRTAATLMLIHFALSKIAIFSKDFTAVGMIVAFIFAYFYTRAMLATFKYHRIMATPRD